MFSKVILKAFLPFLMGLGIGTGTYWLSEFLVSGSEEKLVSVSDKVGSGCGECGGQSDGDLSPQISKAASKPLRIESKPRPVYTDEARQNNVQGTVLLRVAFLASGSIGEVKPIKTLPYGLTEQAVEAAKKIRFKPNRVNGRPVSVTKTVEYTFTIY